MGKSIMSFAQEEIYSIERFFPNTCANNIGAIIHVGQNSTYEKVNNAINALVKQYNAYRIRVTPAGLSLEQYITDYVFEKYPFYEFSNKTQYEKFVIEQINQNIFAYEEPLFRTSVVRLPNNQYAILLILHHLISDAWSMTITFDFLCKFMDDTLIPAIPYNYMDMIENELKYRNSKSFIRDQIFWDEKIKSYTGSAIFEPINPGKDMSCKRLEFELSGEQTRDLEAFCLKEEISITNFMSAILAYYKSFISQNKSVSIGTLVHNRNNKQQKEMVGVFSRVLPLIIEINDDLTVGDFIQHIRSESFSLFRHHRYPYQNILNSNIDVQGLVEIMLSFQNTHFDKNLTEKGYNAEWIHPDISGNPLSIHISSRSNTGRLKFEYDYNNKIITSEEIDLIHNRILKIIGQIITNPNVKLKNIEVISDEEKDNILYRFNKTINFKSAKNKTIVELFEEQVIRTPNNLAVIFGDEQITYAELNKRANQLARKLRSLGVNRNDFVAIMTERSIEMIIGIYGIIKSGGAYVPIDPTYPDDRIEYMLSDCQPKVLLTGKMETPFESGIPTINLFDPEIYTGIDEDPEVHNTPNDLIYLIYTSGTTGRPKGVMVEHKNLNNLVVAYTELYSLKSKDVVLQFASPSFDQSVWDIFNVTLVGGTLCVVPNLVFGNPQAIEDYMNKNKVTVAALTPAFIKELNPRKLPQLRLLESGGASSNIDVLKKWVDNRTIFNTYGPTEATVNSISYEYVGDEMLSTSIPIGRPVANVQVYIMNGTNLCGIGMSGELCITGAGVTRGYLNQPELTKEKFVDNPFGEGKMYRSGDLAKWLPDGNIEYLGRIDEQVKVRGFRIELGEIESVIRKIKGIRDVAVVTKEDMHGEPSICAYMVSDEVIETDEVRGEIRKDLPDYMVPAYMMQIEAIPVNRNGKLDKKSLPVIEVKSKEYVAPRDTTEERITKIFEDVLQITPIGVRDNFFEMGGHSLRAISIVNQLEAEMGVRLPLKSLFESPTVEALSKLIQMDGSMSYSPIPKVEERPSFAMSSAQKRLYVIHEIDGGGTAYNMPVMIEVNGELNLEKIQQVFEQLIERHEVLRTSFHLEDGKPVQRIAKKVAVEVEYEEADQRSSEALLSSFVRPFDLSQAPLARLKVVRFGENQSVIMFDMHHIISDGMSVNILIQEFSILYNEGTLDEQRVQYKDYSEWMSQRDISDQEKYWIEQFKDDVPVLDLPSDFKRPRVQSFKGNTVKTMINPELKEEIVKLSQSTGTTEYMVLLSAFMVLLHKYSRQEDVVVGSPISGRTHRDTEDMLGMFVNTLAMRGKPEKDKKFLDFLEEVKETCLRAYENQEYPFEELVEKVATHRDVTRNPLFDVLFVLQNNEKIELTANGLSFSEVKTAVTTAKFDLSVSVNERDGGYLVSFEYSTDLFMEESIQRMMKHFGQLLLEITRMPSQKISDLDIVTSDEKDQILKKFNNTDTLYPKDKTVIELFEDQVVRTPNNLAVIFGDEQITYAELNKRANQLARKLRSLGVNRNDFVAIMTERSIEMIIGIYGIIKSGGAYVPIDPTYPDDRIEYMLSDCQPKVLLTGKMETPLEGVIPTINLFDPANYTGIDENLNVLNTPNDLIYVIYTSGTTGRPKGVMVEHRNVVRLFVNEHSQFDFNENDVWMLFHSFCFDFSVWEMYGATLFGGKLIVLLREHAQDSRAVVDIIRKEKVTVLNQVPTAFYNLLKVMGNEEFGTIRYLIFGGEALNPTKLKEWKEKHRNTKIINMYGITETTVHVTYRHIEQEEINRGISDIGSAIPTLGVYIMNGSNLCGIGQPGELCVVGAGVTRGYLNQPELTKEKFVDNPFGEGKMYRSGDLAKWLPDGNIEYLGRIDEQVKVRGFRIELGEIESVIRKIKGIRDVAVVTKEDMHGEPSICAYMVSDEVIETDEVRGEIRKDLPDYMVPAYMMQIEAIPVNRNGKLDKKSLPVIEVKSKEYVAPRDTTEERITKIFEDVLQITPIGVRDNFFEMGGHSLRAISIVNQLEAEMGVRLPLKSLFESPTVEALSKLIQMDGSMSYSPIPKVEERPSFAMSSAQKRLYVIHEIDGGGTAYNMPVMIEVNGELNLEKIQQVFEQLIERHEVLRTSFHLEDGKPVQRIAKKVAVEVEYEEADQRSSEALLSSFVRPFDLSQAPLARLKVVRLGENQSVIMFDMHHIISDGMSVNILIQEFSILYNEGTLDEQRVQYKDYSEWMSQRDISDQEKYWIEQFKDDVPVLDLPSDFKRPRVQSFKGNTVKTMINPELKEEIVKLSQSTGTTEYMVLLSAFMVLLHKYSRQEDVVVGSPISGRTHRDTEDMLGMFVNTLAMRGKPEKDKKFLDFLEEVKETCLRAYENQEYPFEELVEKVVTHRDVTRNPLFDVLFVLQNNEKIELTANGLSFSEVKTAVTTAKFDLSVSVNERDGGYLVSFEYSTDLFMEESIQRMMKHFGQLLLEITRMPSQKISDLDIVTSDEKDQILKKFNNTDTLYPKDKTVIELFEDQVVRTPNNLAVIFGDEQITYAELNKRANQLARKLRSLGVNRNDFVAIMTERSIEMIIGIYGIIKSGGAYVPIDPTYPDDRIEYMLSDCQPKVLLTGKMETPLEGVIPTINLFDPANYTGIDENLNVLNTPNDLIYVIYTSGTTGRPKGVMVEHKGISNRIIWMQDKYCVKASDRILFKTPFTFDVSVWEIFGWSSKGASLVLLKSGQESNPEKIITLIDHYSVTIMHFVPSMLAVFIEYVESMGYEEKMKTLRYLLTSGEALKAEQVIKFNQLMSYTNQTMLIDLYGPTEASIEVTYYECLKNEDITRVPIGKPISNIKIYIIDGLNLCGIGIPGELCITGVGVTRGYLNQPELTKEKFVDNPFGEGKMYRSGDLAKWLPDGNIEYLGRIDEQVKVRGFRIELGEIESVIRKVEGTQDVAVITKEDTRGELSIWAYIVSNMNLDIEKIKMEIRKELPEYMVPPYMIRIDAIPVTKHGKLDKNSLPAIEVRNREYLAPRNKVENTLAGVFTNVLGFQIGIDDNFFELGGDSIKAIRVVAALSKEMNISISDIFELQTIRQIGIRVGKRQHSNIVKKLNEIKSLINSQDEDDEIDIGNGEEYIKDYHKYKYLKPQSKKLIRNTLLTGVTGYFGIHLLNELLNTTNDTVWLIVRAENEHAAARRLQEKWNYYFKSSTLERYAHRIVFLAGDISKENLGLSFEVYNELSRNIEIIVNAAANVNHYIEYEKSYSANVQGVINLIEFARYNQRKKIHHISTVSVASGDIEGKNSIVFRECDLDVGQRPDTIYVETKLQAEKALVHARSEDLDINIYRVGNLQCDSKTGVFQANADENAFATMIKAFVILGKYPYIDSRNIDFTPVDYAAEACVTLINNDQLQGETYHILNKYLLSLHELMNSFNEALVHVNPVDYTEFIDYLILTYQDKEKKSYIEMLLLHSGLLSVNSLKETKYIIDLDKTNFILEKLGFKWKEVETKTLRLMIDHFKEIGFFNSIDDKEVTV